MQDVLDIPALAYGANNTLPPGAMQGGPVEGALWRSLVNLRPHDGALRPREAIRPWSVAPPTFLDGEDQQVQLIFPILPTFIENRWLIVTTREAYIFDTILGWVNVTPRETNGTVSITTGTAALTGVGTAWDARRIAPGQQVELPLLSGDWYEIQTVSSDTSITLATNYLGTTLAGANYQIRQTFSMFDYDPVFAVELNGDCYIAGMVSHGNRFGGAGGDFRDGGVLRVTNASNVLVSATSFASLFLTSGEGAPAPGLDNIGYFIFPRGLALLPDGRLVVPSIWADFATSETGSSRVLYSSHLNLGVWTTSPGGFTDVTGRDSLTATTVSTRALHLHFNDGIEVASLTGDDDPPLSFRPSRAHVGAIGPNMVLRVAGGPLAAAGEIFVGSDRKLYRFSGDVATPFNDAANDVLANAVIRVAAQPSGPSAGFSRYDAYRHEAIFAWETNTQDGTLEMRVPLRGDAVYTVTYPAILTACAQAPWLADDARAESVALYGMTRLDDAASETNLLYELREDQTVDSIPDNTGGTPLTVERTAFSDFIFGQPMDEITIAEIVLWVWPTASGSGTLGIDLYRDGTLLALSPSITSFTNGKLVPVRFLVQPPIGAVQNQFEIDNSAKIGRLVRVQVFLARTGNRRTE